MKLPTIGHSIDVRVNLHTETITHDGYNDYSVDTFIDGWDTADLTYKQVIAYMNGDDVELNWY